MSADDDTYEWVVSGAHWFKYRVTLHRISPNGRRREFVDTDYFDSLWSCRRWAKRTAKRDRRISANGGYLARGTT